MRIRVSRLGCVLAVLLVVALLLGAVWFQNARSTALLLSRGDRLEDSRLAMEIHTDLFGTLPAPASTDEHGRFVSWRVAAAEIMEGPEAIEGGRPLFPNPFVLRSGRGDARPQHTNCVAVVGERTVWADAVRPYAMQLAGAKDKILLVEYPKSDVPWRHPVDLSVDEVVAMWESERDSLCLLPSGYEILYVTTSGRFGQLRDIPDKDTLLGMLQVSDSEFAALAR